jgi:Secretion system C-terminal sorting domain
MKRFVLSCSVSMLTSICYCQFSELLHPVISNLQTESKNIVADFSYTLKGSERVHLTWKVNSKESVDFFAIERSANGKDFEMIEVLKSVPGDQVELVDESPFAGRNYYRIKTSLRGKPAYSTTLIAYVGGELPYKFYPNPADNILIVRSDVPLDVQIADASGTVRVSQSKVQGLKTINVAALEKGVYMIRFTNKASNTVTTEKLFKN